VWTESDGGRRTRKDRSRRLGRLLASGPPRHFTFFGTPNFPPSWNVAPTDPLPAVRYDTKAGGRSLDVQCWGLVLTA
jgi:hypothetical protein